MNSVQRYNPMLNSPCPGSGVAKALSLQADFPVFQHHPKLRYLDSAATTHKPRSVIDAITASYEQQCAPVHRGLYEMAADASVAYESARKTVAQFINAKTPEECVFTRSATESINLVATGWARKKLGPSDEVWVSEMEHHANYLPWQRICMETGATLRVVEVSKDGELQIDETAYYQNSVKLIVLTHVSNVLGTINPIADVAQKARLNGIPILVDASQSVGHLPVDVQTLDCDFLVFSGHKCYGPEGIGVLYGRHQYLEECDPILLGGGMVDKVLLHDNNKHADENNAKRQSTWQCLPAKLEAGSPNLSGARGLAAALHYVQSVGVDRLHEHASSLAQKTRRELHKIDGVRVLGYSPAKTERIDKAGIVSFTIEGIHPHDVAQVAADENIAIRAGHHCAQPLMHALGVGSTVRASFGAYNSEADIDALIASVHSATALFKI